MNVEENKYINIKIYPRLYYTNIINKTQQTPLKVRKGKSYEE